MKKYIKIAYLFIFTAFLFQLFPHPIGVISVDEVEHLRTSFLIHQGQVPFRDFFQHHGVLLQYLFSPVFFFVYRDPIIFWIARIAVYLILLGCLYYGIKILDCFKVNKLVSRLFFPLCWGLLAYENRAIFHFRPDVLMLFFFLIGVYYLFKFSNTYQVKSLSISFVALTLSFLSLQKIAVFYPIIILTCLYFLIRKKISIKKLCLASIPAGIILLGYISYLFFTDSLHAYITCCITVNKLLMQSLTHPFQISAGTNIGGVVSGAVFKYLPFFLISLPLIIIRHRSICAALLSIFFLIAYTQLCFCILWVQYIIPLFTIVALLTTLILSDFYEEDNYNLRYINILTCFLCLSIMITHAIFVKGDVNDYSTRYQKLLNIIKEDYTVADEFRNFNIWNPTVAWHEFFLVQDIDYEALGLPKKDANGAIRTHKPDIINAGVGPLLIDLQPEYEEISKEKLGFNLSIWQKKKK